MTLMYPIKFTTMIIILLFTQELYSQKFGKGEEAEIINSLVCLDWNESQKQYQKVKGTYIYDLIYAWRYFSIDSSNSVADLLIDNLPMQEKEISKFYILQRYLWERPNDIYVNLESCTGPQGDFFKVELLNSLAELYPVSVQRILLFGINSEGYISYEIADVITEIIDNNPGKFFEEFGYMTDRERNRIYGLLSVGDWERVISVVETKRNTYGDQADKFLNEFSEIE